MNNSLEIQRTVKYNNHTYELASCKMKRKKARNHHCESNEADVDFLYIAVSGDELPTINLQNELETIAGLGCLGAKTTTRLGHLQSKVKVICTIHIRDIEFIPELGNEGCGFFPIGLFDGVKGFPKRCDAIQARLVGSKVGFIKGMLTAKRGITRIQIPDSMRKAPNSDKTTPNDDLVTLILKSSAPSDPNWYFGRFLDPIKEPPESYTNETKKVMSDMYQRILIGYGVPRRILDEYTLNAKKVKHQKHCNLVGVADPTGHIPYGSVFIPGCK